MSVRNLATRVVKLEVSRRRADELLLVWRRPNGDVRAAARWHGEYSNFSAIEDEYLDLCLIRSRTRVEEGGRPRDAGFADIPHVPAARIRELHDNDLLHMIFGVAN